jgi:uncharacterized protein YbjT (DUF2867 family)
MTVALLTGATGRLGRVLRPKLAAAGHEVRAASRSPPAGGDGAADDGDDTDEWVHLDLAAGTGVESAVAGVDVVVHAASAPTGDTEAVDVAGTERLLAAADDAGVEHFLFTSIVGVDDIPLSYYQHKLTAEAAVVDSDVPHTVLRATQFHSFVDEVIGSVARLPVWPLPTEFRVQPVDARDVAAAVVEYATPPASGRTPPVGGPAVHTLGDVARAYREARGLRRPVVRLPLPGGTARAFRAGRAICPEHAVGTVTWDEWLAERYGSEAESTTGAAGAPS